MAVTSTKTYCTDRDLLDVFPGLSGFDLKRRIYSFVTTDTSNFYKSYNTGEITTLFFDGIEGTAVTDDPNANYEFRYSPGNDSVELFINTANPNDMIIEAGDDWEDTKTRFRQKASRFVESKLDAKLAKDIWYDREKNYPDIIVRLTALETIIMLVQAHDPENAFLEAFKTERNELYEGINNGSIVLPTMRTRDSSEGTIRAVSVDASSDLIPVELIGNFFGNGYELLKVIVTTAGVIGVAKFSVFGKSDTALKAATEEIVDNDIIDGDYQFLGVGNLHIRWGGDDVATATCALNDEYEIELFAQNLGTSTARNTGSVHLTRR